MPLYPPSATIRDEGVSQGVVDIIDFTGAGVVSSVSGNVATVNITGGAIDYTYLVDQGGYV